MKKFIAAAVAATTLCACTSTGALTTKPSAVDPAVTAQKAQNDFKWACFVITGASMTYTALSPILVTKLDASQQADAANAAAAGQSICSKPLDVTNAQTVVQQLMDAAGQIAAVIAKAQST